MKKWIPAELWRDETLDEGLLTAAWLARTLGREFCAQTPAEGEAGELALPVETLLEAGGDARIISSPESGMNRYGATSRPRPEAVHFSSSTASSVSDYAFAALDALRRALLVDVLFHGLSLADANERLAEALRRDYRMLTLSEDEADVIWPSGTDTELLALIVRAPARASPTSSSPRRNGRAVKTAAAELYFQEGAAFAKGKRIWAAADIEVSSVSARDEAGRPFPLAAVDRAVGAMLEIGISQRRRALLHVLIGSKTGISAPSPKFVAVSGSLQATSTSSPTPVSGTPPAKPWASGCAPAGWRKFPVKFFTGPPLCGALVVPAKMRERREAAARLWGEAPNSAGELLGSRLARRLRPEPRRRRKLWAAHALGGCAHRGDVFRQASLEVARTAFDAFCAEVRGHLSTCPHLAELEPPHFVEDQASRRDFEFSAGSSIICFAGLIDDGADGVRRLDGAELEKLFRWLNADLENRLPDLDPLQGALARQPFHLGQPVDLTPGADPPNVILRLVIGARFFSTIAMAGEQGNAALDAEIADALRAFDKAELILSKWRELSASG